MKKRLLSLLVISMILFGNIGLADSPSFIDIGGIDGEEAIIDLLDKRIVKGISEDKFMPEKPVTRAEILSMLKRLERLDDKYIVESEKKTDFLDVKPGSWYKNAVEWASGGNIVRGVGNNRFEPNRVLNREELGVIVYDYIENSRIDAEYIEPWQVFEDEDKISDWASSKVNTMCTNSIMICDGKKFGPKDKVSREEAAIVVQNILKKW